jgi:hypothetical protein
MTSSTDVALQSFESFINKEGEVVQAGLTDHFETLSQHLSAQNGTVCTVVTVSNTVSYIADKFQRQLYAFCTNFLLLLLFNTVR